MSWQLYQLRFRVLSPLHVGRQKIGNIQLARPYVMARHLWAAVTARLTRDAQYAGASGTAKEYEEMGKRVKEQLAFTYLYPEDRPESRVLPGRPLFPRWTEQGLRYGREDKEIDADVFAWRYLNSYASTALDYSANAAEEGTLHEAEYLSPQTRKDGNCLSHPVFLTGYVFERAGCDLPWRWALSEIQIGGERKSGWGRVRLCPISHTALSKETKLFGFMEWLNSGERPRVNVATKQPLLAHTLIEEQSTAIAADVEPLVGRVWEKTKGSGQYSEYSGVCYAPGSTISENDTKCFELAVGHVWQSVPCE